MRLVLLLINCLFIYWAACALQITNKAIPFVLFWLCPLVVYYTTEIKQYSFELVASYIMIISIATVRSRWDLRLANVSALLLSFGAVIEVAAQTIMRTYGLVVGWRQATVQKIVDLAVTAAILLLFALWAKYFTALNLKNFDDQAYKNVEVVMDTLKLGKVLVQAHGVLFLATGFAVLAVALRVFGWQVIVHSPLIVFLLLCVLMVVALRLMGLIRRCKRDTLFGSFPCPCLSWQPGWTSC